MAKKQMRKFAPAVLVPTVSRNLERDGIEIRFPAKPRPEVMKFINELNDQSIRETGRSVFVFTPWGNPGMAKWQDPKWYAKYDEALWQWANQLVAFAKTLPPEIQHQPATAHAEGQRAAA